jgi:predicted nuclease of restriction endonuclease-like (RecB) superfamily
MNSKVNIVGYMKVVESIKREILSSRMKAILSANKELLELYWRIGNIIIEQQIAAGWGEKVVDRLSADLQAEFPDMKGLSARNLQYMKAFARLFPNFVQQVAAQLSESEKSMQQLAAQLPWFHLCTLIQKVKIDSERFFYMQKAISNGWSRAVLVHQIESGLYQREGSAVSNFTQTLPALQGDLAKQTLKDPYIFDFLSLRSEYDEKELEAELTTHISRFLLELGAGFAFLGRQYHVQAGGDDFYIDLLFYHIKLHCYVVVELKTSKFKPEYAGKLNFYLSLVDDILKTSSDQPTIGMLICKEQNRVVAEYALRGLQKPIGISEYQLAKAVPDQFKGSLPTVEELEQELSANASDFNDSKLKSTE